MAGKANSHEPIVIITDTREQTALDFSPFYGHGIASSVETVHTGDYTEEEFHTSICFERKSLDDLVNTMIYDYESDSRKPPKRFNRTLERMAHFYNRSAVIVDADYLSLLTHKYRSLADPKSVEGKIQGAWMTYGIPFIFTGGRTMSARWIAGLARHYSHARHRKFFLPEE